MSAVTDALKLAAPLAAPLVRLVANVVDGTIREPGDVAKTLMGIALDAAPVDDLKAYLDDEARARQDAAFELAKLHKLGRL